MQNSEHGGPLPLIAQFDGSTELYRRAGLANVSTDLVDELLTVRLEFELGQLVERLGDHLDEIRVRMQVLVALSSIPEPLAATGAPNLDDVYETVICPHQVVSDVLNINSRLRQNLHELSTKHSGFWLNHFFVDGADPAKPQSPGRPTSRGSFHPRSRPAPMAYEDLMS